MIETALLCLGFGAMLFVSAFLVAYGHRGEYREDRDHLHDD